jgi:hypothetical protein
MRLQLWFNFLTPDVTEKHLYHLCDLCELRGSI